MVDIIYGTLIPLIITEYNSFIANKKISLSCPKKYHFCCMAFCFITLLYVSSVSPKDRLVLD